MVKRLIVNADDYGYAPEVSKGILQAFREGIVTSTTAMVNAAGVESQLEEALVCPGLGLGLHLVFTTGRPLLPAGRLAGYLDADGCFFDHHTLWAKAEELPAAPLLDEFEAQVQRFVQLAGRLPDHLDCHHFAHVFPPIFQIYAEVAARLDLPLRIPFPIVTDYETAPAKLPYLEGFPRELVRGMVVTNSAVVKGLGVRHPENFVSSFYGRAAVTREGLLRLLTDLSEGTTELMCHPGYMGPGLASSNYQHEREKELAVLVHPDVRRFVLKEGIELVTYGDL